MAIKLYQGNYPFSKDTVEGKSLINNPEGRTAILQASGVYDYAHDVNDGVDQVLNKKGIIDKNDGNVLALKNPKEDLTLSNHPRALGLLGWINLNSENQKWYDENKGTNFNLVDGGRIELLGDILKAEDEKTKPNQNNTWDYKGNILFNRSAAENQQTIGKGKFPEWRKYIGFLPGDDKNKSEFLQKVLGLSIASCHNWNNANLTDDDIIGLYWSKGAETGSVEFLEFDSNSVDIGINYSKTAFGFSLRLIEN